jgi:hypothetical protein
MALTRITSTVIADNAITTEKVSQNVALGVKIANVSIANSTYSVLDDTAVNVAGGYIVVTGSGFQSGAEVIIGETPATSTTFVSSTLLRAQVPAANAATYTVFVVNPDGGSGTKPRGITYSGTPTWVTGSTLNYWIVDDAANVTFNATGAVSYSNTTALPTGTTLLSNGYFYGTVTGIESDTTYNFTIRATDAEAQDSDRSFSLTVYAITYPESVEYLIVAGGGAGGAAGGGGGAGGFLTGNTAITLSQTYNVVVGSGGSGIVYPGSGISSPGSNSSFAGVVSIGGGSGASQYSPSTTVSSGGSGGGGTYSYKPGGAGTAGQGNRGGNGGNDPWRPTAGGGGAAAQGGDAGDYQSTGGGNGILAFDSNYYAGGGGGGATGQQNPIYGSSPGGQGGGGSGGAGGTGTEGQVGGTGTVNTGGGGGGGGEGVSTRNNGGPGGSGVVIIRYSDTYADASVTTGSPTYTNTGGYKTYKFTGSGSITW